MTSEKLSNPHKSIKCVIFLSVQANEITVSMVAALDALRSGIFHFIPLRPYRRRRAGCSPSLASKRRKNQVRRGKLSCAKGKRRPAPAHLEAAQRQFLFGKNGPGRVESGTPRGNYLPLSRIGAQKKSGGYYQRRSCRIAPVNG